MGSNGRAGKEDILPPEHHDLVQVSPPPTDGAQAYQPLLPDLGREHRTEALPPEAHRFVAHLDAAIMEQVPDVAE